MRNIFIIIAVFVVISSVWGVRSGHSASIIRDAEVERSLKQLARPLLRASGVPLSTEILIIDARSMNAFVIGRTVFLHSGLIERVEDPAMLQAVIAHELGHITGGHIVQRYNQARSTSSALALGLVLGGALAASGEGEAGAALGSLTAETVQRHYLSFSRAQESAADQSGLRYMRAAGLDLQGVMRVFDLFRGQEALSASRRSAYTLTHPLWGERVSAMKAQVAASQGGEISTHDQYWFGRMRAKFQGFMGNPAANLRRVGAKDMSEPARLLRAISYHRLPDPKSALREVNALIALRPNDPFYHELKGDFLLVTRDVAQALSAYERALALAPEEPLLKAALARAYLARGGTADPRKARALLEDVYRLDQRDPRMLRDLATAYAQTGEPALASLAIAEHHAILGQFEAAALHAKRARAILGEGSRAALKAEDILAAARQAGVDIN